jgi:nitroreductase
MKDMGPEALYEGLKERRSINLPDLVPEAIDPACVQQMLEAAHWAPSHGHTEPWRFMVFTGPAREKLGDIFARVYQRVTPAEHFDATVMAFNRERVLRAPVWISIGMQPDPVKCLPEWEEVSAVAMAVHNMQLMACSLGLGSQWLSGATNRHALAAQCVGLQPPAQLLRLSVYGETSQSLASR